MNNGESAILVIRTNKGDGKWWHTHKLGSVTCKSELSNDGRFEATVVIVSAAKKDRQTKLTKPDRAVARLLGRLSIKVKLGVRRITTEERHDSEEPDMRGTGRFDNFYPTKAVLVVVFRDRTRLFQGGNDIRPFFLRQETRRLGRAGKDEKRHHAKCNSKYAFL